MATLEEAPSTFTISPEEYIASLRRLAPAIYKFGERIPDVTTDPATRYTVQGIAGLYRLARDPAYQDLLTVPSELTGGRVSRYLSIMRSPEDAKANIAIKRLAFQQTGTCTGARCAGWSGLNALWAVTYDLDRAQGSDYHLRLRHWLRDAQRHDIAIAGALTDVKGNRALSAGQQPDPDMYVRIVGEREDGIVVRGAKAMIAGACSAHEILVTPGNGYRPEEADYAVAFAIPIDAPGLTLIEARQPSDTRKAEAGFDKGTEAGGISQAYLFFDDVFVPRERVFLCREAAYAAAIVRHFVVVERATMGGCVAGQGDVKLGAAALLAACNGLGLKPLVDKFVEMVVQNETLYGVGLAACVAGEATPSGAFLPDPLLSNVSKVNVARLPYDTTVLAQEIAGGIGETGCMPSYADFADAEVGPLVQKYLKAGSSAESRMRAARLLEFCTIGAGVPGCMHGGGSPAAARLMIRGAADFAGLTALAKRLAGVEEDVRL